MSLDFCWLHNNAEFNRYVVDLRQFLGTDVPVCRSYSVQRFQQLLLSLIAFTTRFVGDGLT